MKKIIIFAPLLISLLSTTTGFIISRGTQSMGVRMSAKDLSEYGLTIILPSDPEFVTLTAEQFKGMSDDVIDRIKPFSFLIKNTSRRTVVAHAIIWECVDANGRSRRFKKIHANSEALTDPEEYFSALPRTNLDDTVRPGKARLFSLLALPQSVGGQSPGGGGSGGFSPGQPQALGDDESSITEKLEKASSQMLSRCAELTAVIDGAFFDDGTFIGPDQAGLFDQVKIQVEAKLELRREMGEKLEQGASADDIFKDLESKANSDAVRNLASAISTEERRNHFRKFFATLFLQQNKAYGKDRALEMVLGPKGKVRPEPKLRKIKSPADVR